MHALSRQLLALAALWIVIQPVPGLAAPPLQPPAAQPGSAAFVGPLSPVVPTAAEQRAEELRRLAAQAQEAGRPNESLQRLQQIPAALRTPGDAVAIGTLQIAAGNDVEEAIAALLAIDPAGLDPALRNRRWQALLGGLNARGETFNALTVIDQSLPLAAGEERENLCREERALLTGASDAELANFAGRLGPTAVRADLQTERGRRILGAKESAAARRLLDEALNGTAPFCSRGEALRMRDALEGGFWLRSAVGVILPLRDKFASFGEAVNRGIDMALAERPAKAKPIAFIVQDSGSDADGNARAVARLANEERVMAIVGPLTGGAALAAGEEAQRLKIPLIALAQKDGIPEIGDYVFRDALTNRRQVEALARYAVEGEGMKRFAILAPQNRLGQEFAELFSQALTRRGGSIVARQGYGEDAIDFRTPVKLLKGENPALPDPVEKESSRKVRTGPAPALPFEALFIPDAGERVGLLAPYLAYYGLENVLLLGTSAWNTPELFERSARYVEGAVLVDGFYQGSAQPRVRDFVARYSERYGEEPSVLEAEGYDLARLLIGLLERQEIRSRSELRSALERVTYPGVTGELSFDPVGDARKEPHLLRIQDGALIGVETGLVPQ